MPPSGGFPSMKSRKMLKVLRSLGYRPVPKSGQGSHKDLVCAGRPTIRWAFHDKATLAPGLVRTILVRQAGLTLDEAKEVVGNV